MIHKQLMSHSTNSGKNDFFFMINPYFPTDNMIKELNKNMKHLIMHYPSHQKIISDKVRRLENVDRPLIAVNGSCEAIKVFMQNFSKKALILSPNFGEWYITDHINVPYNISTYDLLKAIDKYKVDTVCICNPNNPTGIYRGDIELLAAQYPDINFAIDISFLDFVDYKMPSLPKGKNIILVKSLGKNYGLCGLRLGYIATENKKIIDRLWELLPIWNINSIAEFMIDLIQKNKKEYEKSRIKIIEGTRKMRDFLKTIPGIEVYPTYANYVMIKSDKDFNFNIKRLDNKKELGKRYYRIAYRPNYKVLRRLLK